MSVESVLAEESTFNEISGNRIVTEIRKVLEVQEHCVMGLSGGSTPKAIYQWLGTQALEWNRVTFYIVDERYIPATESTSNTNMIRNALTQGNLIKENQIIYPNTSLSLQECITNYQQTLEELFNNKGTAKKSSHIVILGMGGDGHIASIFPEVEDDLLPGVKPKETIFHTTTDIFDVKDRITISLEQIAASDCKIFLLKGKEKEETWTAMNNSDYNIKRWPALYVTQSQNVIAICSFPSYSADK